MANQYDTNLKLQAIADAIGDSGSSGLISALEDIADAVAGGGGGGSSIAGLVSDNFSETDTYDLGDYCIHNNTLYVCINAITTPGAWDLSDWQATNTGIELSSLNSALVWKQAGSSATGTTPIDISGLTDYNELLVSVDIGGSGNVQTFSIPKIILKSSNQVLREGGYSGAQAFCMVLIYASTSSISLYSAIINNQTPTATSVTSVYYR